MQFWAHRISHHKPTLPKTYCSGSAFGVVSSGLLPYQVVSTQSDATDVL